MLEEFGHLEKRCGPVVCSCGDIFEDNVRNTVEAAGLIDEDVLEGPSKFPGN